MASEGSRRRPRTEQAPGQPKTPQDGAKVAPRGYKIGLRRAPEMRKSLTHIWLSYSLRSSSFQLKMVPRKAPDASKRAHEAHKNPQDDPRPSPAVPNGPRDDPKTALRRFQGCPGPPQDSLRLPRDRPPPKGPHEVPRASKMAPRDPMTAPRQPSSAPNGTKIATTIFQ